MANSAADLLSALDEEAREHRESFAGRKRSGSTLSATNVQASPISRNAGPVTRAPVSLLDSLEDDARELREEAFQSRRASVTIAPPPNVNAMTRKATPAMSSVYGKAKIRLPGDLVTSHHAFHAMLVADTKTTTGP